MALGNWGVTRNLIQGLVASEPAEENRVGGITGIFTDSQGLALFADQITQVATRLRCCLGSVRGQMLRQLLTLLFKPTTLTLLRLVLLTCWRMRL